METEELPSEKSEVEIDLSADSSELGVMGHQQTEGTTQHFTYKLHKPRVSRTGSFPWDGAVCYCTVHKLEHSLQHVGKRLYGG
eukprot:1159950-Pelagomonas_calceolata.AAC.2